MGAAGVVGAPAAAQLLIDAPEQIAIVDAPAASQAPVTPAQQWVTDSCSPIEEASSWYAFADTSDTSSEETPRVPISPDNHNAHDDQIPDRSLLERSFAHDPLAPEGLLGPLDEAMLGDLGASSPTPGEETAGTTLAPPIAESVESGGGIAASAAESRPASSGEGTRAVPNMHEDETNALQQFVGSQFQAAPPPPAALGQALPTAPPIPPVTFQMIQTAGADGPTFFSHGQGVDALLSSHGVSFFESSAEQVHVTFVGANTVVPTGVDPVAGTVQAFPGISPVQLKIPAPSFAKLDYTGIYAGINLEFYGNAQGQSEHDFQLSAGANPGLIRMQFTTTPLAPGGRGVGGEGVSLTIDSHGNLQVATAHGGFVEQAPFIYQTINGVRHQVQGGFVMLGANEVGFNLGSYRHDLGLVIDPVVTVNFNNNTPATVHFGFGGVDETVSTLLTQFAATATGTGGAITPLFFSWCIDPNHFVSAGQTYDVSTRTDLASAFPNGPRIAWVYQTAGEVDLTNDPVEAAAVQLALWALLPDHPADHFAQDPGGTYSCGDPDVFSVADLPNAAEIVARTDQLLRDSLGATTAGNWFETTAGANQYGGKSLLLPLLATGVDVQSVEGQVFSGTVGTFFFADPDAPASNFSATVDWGDGSALDTNTSVVALGGGRFAVTGSHPYIAAGQYTATVTITQSNGATATANSTATVDDAPLTALPAPDLFAPQASYGAGNTPDSIAPLTLDDGTQVLLVANFFGNNVSVLMGNGDGTFQPATALPTGGGPNGFAVGDFNNDGHEDFAIANYNDNTVSVYLGDGTGNFTAGPTLATGSGPANEMAIGDFNGDGNLDLATANFNDGTVSVFMGNGDGTFAAATSYNVGGGIAITAINLGEPGASATGVSLAVADFNNSTVRILANNGDGTFTVGSPIAVGANPWYITAADLNGDGKTDLATANFYGGVSVLLSNGNGTFQPPVEYATGSNPTGVVAGDINGDGTIDLVAANYSSNNVSLLAGNGDGTFGAPQNFAAGSGPNELTLGYFSGDGMLDIAVANQNGNDASVLLNQTVQGTEGLSFNAVVAKITDANPFATADDFEAIIDWGDGTSSTASGSAGPVQNPDGTIDVPSSNAGTITQNTDGTFSVHGSHPYAQPGTYTVAVLIGDVGGSTATTSLTVHVADAPLTATGTHTTAAAGRPVSAVLATFTDANPNAAPGDFQASVDWGDGTGLDTNGTIVANPSGGFDVRGINHVYAVPGTYTVTVRISDAGSSTTTATSIMDISGGSAFNAPPELTVPSAMTVNPGSTVAFQVSAFDPDNDPLTLSAANLPPGATFMQNSSTTGLFTWTPAYGQWGNFAPTFSVDDNQGEPNSEVSQNVALTVLTPQQLLAGLVAQLQALQDRGLNAAAGNAILGNIQAALRAVNDNDLPAADALLDRGQNLIDGMRPDGMPDPVGPALGLIQEALVGLLVLQQGQKPTVKAPPIQGPHVVPGNSIYEYIVQFQSSALSADVPLDAITWTITDLAGRPSTAANDIASGIDKFRNNPIGRVTGVWVRIAFDNVPISLEITAKYDIAGTTYVSDPFGINVVKLTTSDVPEVPGSQLQSIDPSTLRLKMVSSLIKLNFLGVPSEYQLITTLATPAGVDFGFGWGREVNYTPPDPGLAGPEFDLAHLQVGFVQHVQPLSYNATYLDGTVLTSSMQSNKFILDSPARDQPASFKPFKPTAQSFDHFVTRSPLSDKFALRNDNSFIDLTSNDTPRLDVPIFTAAIGFNRVKKVNIVLNFVVDVVARTDEDLAGSANDKASLWIVSTFPWKVNVNATIGSLGNPVGFANTGQGISFTTWVDGQAPQLEQTTGPSANAVQDQMTFR